MHWTWFVFWMHRKNADLFSMRIKGKFWGIWTQHNNPLGTDFWTILLSLSGICRSEVTWAGLSVREVKSLREENKEQIVHLKVKLQEKGIWACQPPLLKKTFGISVMLKSARGAGEEKEEVEND